MRHVLALIVALAGAFPFPADARPPQPSSSLRVDVAVRQLMQEQHIPGVGLAVVRHGKLIVAKGYGLANVELATPVSSTTIFEAGSITKQFVAAAIMLLAQDGKLKLEDNISRYFPEASPAMKTVTIRNLLTHTSGIPDVSDGTNETSGAFGVVDFHR